jgi:phosphoribosylformylglycinamidine synthase subunit PurQ / glutaminase
VRIGVVTFPGSLDDGDARRAVRFGGAEAVALWHGDADLYGVDAVVLPGGFSYGDYLRCGAIARFSPVMASIIDAAHSGLPVLGICNGFQVLTEAGLLPGVLMRNSTLKFICKDVHLRVERNDSIYTHRYQRGEVVRFPIAHKDGSYFADAATLKRLEDEGLVAFRYCDPAGEVTADANPNGSCNNIAGIYNKSGTVLGVMPHPERLADATLGGTDGTKMFLSLVETLH